MGRRRADGDGTGSKRTGAQHCEARPSPSPDSRAARHGVCQHKGARRQGGAGVSATQTPPCRWSCGSKATDVARTGPTWPIWVGFASNLSMSVEVDFGPPAPNLQRKTNDRLQYLPFPGLSCQNARARAPPNPSGHRVLITASVGSGQLGQRIDPTLVRIRQTPVGLAKVCTTIVPERCLRNVVKNMGWGRSWR